MAGDLQDIVGTWTVKFKRWTWEYTFTGDGEVTWRDPLNNMHGSGRWTLSPKSINLSWLTSPTKESWQRPITPNNQSGSISASYGTGPFQANKADSENAPTRSFVKPSFASRDGASFTADNRLWRQELDYGDRAIVGITGITGITNWREVRLEVNNPSIVAIEKESPVSEYVSGIRVTFKVVGTAPGDAEVTAFAGDQLVASMQVHVRAQASALAIYVDSFITGYYDPNFRSQGGNWSKYIIVQYVDDVALAIHIDRIGEERIDFDTRASYIAQGGVGERGRRFPLKMTAATTPNLYNLKRQAIQKMSLDLIDLMRVSREAIIFVLTVGEIARSLMGDAFKLMARRNAPPPIRRVLEESEAELATTVRPRATPQQLRQMAANKEEWLVWRTADEDVASNQTIKHTGQNTPAGPHPPQLVYVARGVRGLPYGKYCVAVRVDAVRAVTTPDALELVLLDEIPANEGVWYTTDDLAAAGIK